MKKTTDNLDAGTAITFKRGCLAYEGTILDRDTTADGRITTYRVSVDAPGGGPPCDEVWIHDGQILRVYNDDPAPWSDLPVADGSAACNCRQTEDGYCLPGCASLRKP